MASQENNTECMITCWGIAAFAGLVAMVMLFWFAQFSALQAIFTGGLIGTVLGLLLSLTVCGGQKAAADLASDEKPAVRYAAKAAEQRAQNAAARAAVVTPSAMAGSADGAAGAGLSAGTAGIGAGTAGTTSGSAGVVDGVAPSATNRTVTVGGPEAGTVPDGASDTSAPTGTTAAVSGSSSAVMSKAVPKAAAKAKPKAATADAKPAVLLEAARPEGKDDLKLISGVGPKLEETLNDLGVYHFDQVAAFKKKDIAWVDERLRFKGRIERDDWMSQAKVLAKGGETEFSKAMKKS
jgi:predicted flap endonuclease-1-like 5' DNA nuclease